MTPAPRRRDPDAKRAALHAAAFALFAEQPFQAVTMAQIAARAGIAVGSCYRFYPGKLALLAALSDALEADFAAAMQSAWQQGGPYRDRLSRLATALFDLIASRRQDIAVMQITAGNRTPGSRPMGERVRQEIALLYADGVANAGFHAHDPHEFAAAAHGLVEGLMHDYFARADASQQHHAGLLAVLLQRLALPEA